MSIAKEGEPGVHLSGPATQPAALLEREQQLALVAELTRSATAGSGALVAILGGPGTGKTALLAETCRIAAAQGMRVCRARGSELERGFALGAARQLLEPAVRALDPGARAELLQGAAGLAAGVLDLGAERTPENPFAVPHGLYWLLAGLAERTPVLLALDDAHWADGATLQWLTYLSARLDGLPLLVAFAARASEPRMPDGSDTLADEATADAAAPQPPPTDDLLLRLGGGRRLTRIRVEGLSLAAVATLAERALGAAPEERFTAELHRVTAGNPFAVHELLGALARARVAPTAAAAGGLGGRAPEALREDVLRRVQRLGGAAVAAAQGVAVLGDRAVPRQVAALSELDLEETAAALDALAREAVLTEGPALAFAHPLIGTAVHDAIPARRRARLHARAATLLRSDGADAEAVAAHLLRSDPEGSADSVASLRSAAAAALRRGDPAPAVAYLTRALAEPAPPPQRPALLAELGRAETLIRSPASVEHLQAALELSEDAVQRTRLRWLLSDTLFFAGEWDPALAQLEQALAELGECDPDLALRLEGRLLTLGTLDARAAANAHANGDASANANGDADSGAGAGRDRRIEHLRGRAGAALELDGVRPLRLNLALLLATRASPPAELAGLIERGLDGGRFLALEGADAVEAVHGAFALALIDDLDEALAHTSAMLADAAARGSVLGFLAGATFRALVHLRRGALAEAEADAAPALELAREQELHFTIPFIASYLALTLLERGRAREAAELLAPLPLPPALAGTPAGVTLLEARGRVHAATGERERALEDLRACGAACQAVGIVNPNIASWRSELALLLRDEAPAEARELAADELALAREARVARGVGIALRASAALGDAGERESLLGDAIATLEDSPARLELARALLDLGAHLRREGQRTRAREPLRRALDLAHGARAEALAERAREELAAAGARPRRPWLTGVDALTPSELRVARLAAEGRTNQEIAQALFVTTQTVKGHLSVVYRKLGIASRRALAQALAQRSDA